MDVEAAIRPLCGRMVEVCIEDLAGRDPVAPPRTFELLRVKLLPEGTHLQCYLNVTQFLSIPVFGDERTKLTLDGPSGTTFVSEDSHGQLRYTMFWKSS
ncbi:hypothetical protein PaecuDRAFT_0879 [Paenibacillus curdlanolyticus YK9]|uniref:Uncharacterized protein n=1 Tax=Paenibacillus curdlanolyticus YK9 TaxID=717606 RepID=E0I5F7_9BACL|nr:hypothetical protein [Paenibacillus curdlanolyticus]EFM12199.1 hypothetical protein PaecuDRAFT_0879 [Paenibacillus curdlanolyticus YK9]